MSMLQAFERLLNRKRDEAQQREERVDREGQDETEDGEGAPALVCRACGYEGDEPYCPSCLSDTMKPSRRARKKKSSRPSPG